MCITNTSKLMLFRAVLTALCSNNTELENALCGKSAVF